MGIPSLLYQPRQSRSMPRSSPMAPARAPGSPSGALCRQLLLTLAVSGRLDSGPGGRTDRCGREGTFRSRDLWVASQEGAPGAWGWLQKCSRLGWGRADRGRRPGRCDPAGDEEEGVSCSGCKRPCKSVAPGYEPPSASSPRTSRGRTVQAGSGPGSGHRPGEPLGGRDQTRRSWGEREV